MDKPEIVIGYWKIRGLAEPIRLLLEHLGVHYKEEEYELGDAPDFNPEQWASKKHTLGLEFPNLPYLIDGSLKITETLAIMRYICNKHDPKLMGAKLEEQAKVDELAGLLSDLNNYKTIICYAKNPEDVPKNVLQGLEEKIKSLAKVLGTRKHVAGDKLTYIDFYCVELLEAINDLIEPIFKTYPIFEHYFKGIMNLPNIQKYRNSDKFLKDAKAYNNKIARLGSTLVKKD